MSELFVLDVGHGNAAVLLDDGHAVVVDAGRGDTVAAFLTDRGVSTVDWLLLSHSDDDHIFSAPLLLRSFHVRNVALNPDPTKRTKSWKRVRTALEEAAAAGTTVWAELTTNTTGQIALPHATVEVLFPRPAYALGGVGGEDDSGNKLMPNTLSAVVRVTSEGSSTLLAGDLDEVGLTALITWATDIRADRLVFPHHGGRPKRSSGGVGDVEELFAARLVSTVESSTVVFSTGRGRGNPRASIVRGVESVERVGWIVCTELSEYCAPELPPTGVSVPDVHGRGASSNSCCLGTMCIGAGGETPTADAHREFVATHVTSPLCAAVLARR